MFYICSCFTFAIVNDFIVLITHLVNCTDHKVHLYIKSTTSLCPLVGFGKPQPLSRMRVCPSPPEPKVGGAHSPASEGVGESQFRRLEKKLSTLPTLWYGCTIDPMGLKLKSRAGKWNSPGGGRALAGALQWPSQKIRQKMGVWYHKKTPLQSRALTPKKVIIYRTIFVYKTRHSRHSLLIKEHQFAYAYSLNRSMFWML